MNRFNLSALAVRERAVTLFLIIAIAAAGAFAFLKLGRAEDPAFTIKILSVTAAGRALRRKRESFSLGTRFEDA